MQMYSICPIGRIAVDENGFSVRVEPKYAAALAGLDGFSHVCVLYWFDQNDLDAARAVLTVEQPYLNGPDMLGIFATRAPMRPNPIALSTARILAVDQKNSRILLDYIDAEPGSPVVDIKPYTPSLDRVEAPAVPDWCAHWPYSREASATFDWGSVFAEDET